MDKRLLSVAKCCIALVLILSTFISLPVWALTESHVASGEGSLTCGSYVGGAGNFTNITSNDAMATYWQASGAGGYKTWNFVNSALAGVLVNSVTLSVYHRSTSGGSATQSYPVAYIGGITYSGDLLPNLTTEVYASYTWTTSPATGVAWTIAEINAAEFGVHALIVSGGAVYDLDYIYIVIDYTAPSVASVTTSSATGIEYTGGQHKATLNGSVTDDGGPIIDYYGFVWDTSDKGDPGNLDPSGPPGTWTSGWKSAVGNYGENPFSHQITGLIINTTYYYRAAAHNSVGWSYGAAISFRTLANPAITTVAASNVAAIAARLNSSVTDDGKLGGGENCTVVFIYVLNAGAHHANYAAILAAGGTEVTATGTYNTGGSPYYDISGLVAATNYDFAVKITNQVSTQYGGVLYFVTVAGVLAPTNFTAVPTSTTISLSFVKGVGSSNTFIRYDTAGYPLLITGGLGTVYAGTGNSYLVAGLTPGQNYYFSAWGLSSGTYSASYVSVIATCLASDPPVVPKLPPPNTPGSWSVTSSVAAVANIPFSEFVNYFADSYDIPQTTMWYGLIIMFSVGAGLFAYWRGNNNLLAGILVCAVGLIIGSIVWQLIYLWILVFFLMAGFAMAWIAQRY